MTRMPTTIEVPTLGESITEAVLLRWLKNDGEYVGMDEPLAELETDKANVDIPSRAAGILHQSKKAGDTVRVGEAIARIDDAPAGARPAPAPKSAQAAATTAPPSPKPQGLAQMQTEDLRPSVRRLVEENKLNPASIT